MKVLQIMTPDPACCHPDSELTQVARMMVDCDCGEIPVVDTESMTPVGVVTDRDIVCRAIALGMNPLELTAADCMSAPVVTVTPDSSVEECQHLMERHQLRRLLVVDQSGQVCGIVAQADLAQSAPAETTGEVVRGVSQPRAAA